MRDLRVPEDLANRFEIQVTIEHHCRRRMPKIMKALNRDLCSST